MKHLLGVLRLQILFFADVAIIIAESPEVLVMPLKEMHEKAKALGFKFPGSRPGLRCLKEYWVKKYSLFMCVARPIKSWKTLLTYIV